MKEAEYDLFYQKIREKWIEENNSISSIFSVLIKKQVDELQLIRAINSLLYEIANKHNVKTTDEFTCPHIRHLAKLVNWEPVKI